MRSLFLIIISVLALQFSSIGAPKSSTRIAHVEPMSWWTGMATPLQIMFHGEGIGNFKVSVKGDGVTIVGINRADSPNYIFVDVAISDKAKAGVYMFEFSDGSKRIEHPYLIEERKAGSALRSSFTSSDLMYLIMPDRFANGDPSNDNTTDTAEKSDRSNLHGRHGGDIQGIIDRLGYMQELGVTALWSTPLLVDNEPTYSYHGYACSDYYKVDPRYGSNELYREMVRQAHNHGIKVISDVVTNHCGTSHWWMDDLPFNDWINQFPSYTQTNNAMTSLADPNASQYDRNLFVTGWFDRSMADMNLRNSYVLQYFKQWAIWWIEWAGIDGLRVDTYPYNDPQAMSEWCKAVTNEYPNMNIVGECWITSPSQASYWERGARNKDGFNSNLPSIMDFSLQDAIVEGLKKDTLRWGEGLQRVYNSLANDFVYNEPNNLLIFLDNHDTDRLADMLGGNPDKIKLALTMLATLRGVPQLYYGTELMFVSDNIKEGHGGARIDFPGGWIGDTRNLFSSSDRTKKESDVFDYAKKIFNWRKDCGVIHSGKTRHFSPLNNTYSYFRYDDNRLVFVYINASRKSQAVDWSRYLEITDGFAVGLDVITGDSITIGEELNVQPLSSLVVEFR